MSATKRQICEDAFAELALAGHAFDLNPEEMETALRRLDLMVAAWDRQGIRIGYALPDAREGSDLDEECGAPDGVLETLYTNLAVRLGAVFGKNVSADTKSTAANGFRVLQRDAARPREIPLPGTLPRGAGNRWSGTRNPFFPAPATGPLDITEGGDLDILPE